MSSPTLARIPPGSPAALEAGCACSTDTNRGGMGLKLSEASKVPSSGLSVQASQQYDSVKYFHVADHCPLHGNGAAAPEVEQETTTQNEGGPNMAAREIEELAVEIHEWMLDEDRDFKKSEIVEVFNLSQYEWQQAMGWLRDHHQVEKIGNTSKTVYRVGTAGSKPVSEEAVTETGPDPRTVPQLERVTELPDPEQLEAIPDDATIPIQIRVSPAERDRLAAIAVRHLLGALMEAVE